MRDVDAGLFREQHRAEMNAAAFAGGSVIELAWLLLGERDQYLHIMCGQRRIHQNDEWTGGDQSDRREILARVVADVGVKRQVNRKRAGAAEAERVAVGRGLGDLARAERTAGATMILDDDLLA